MIQSDLEQHIKEEIDRAITINPSLNRVLAIEVFYDYEVIALGSPLPKDKLKYALKQLYVYLQTQTNGKYKPPK